VALLAVLIPTVLLACKEPATEATATAEPVAAISEEAPTCGKSGFFRATLVGGITTVVNWSAEEVRCENMLRPQGKGARLRFTGEVDSEQLAFIVALPALRSGEVGKELPSNVTITVEGSGRFFSTPGLDSCWTDIAAQQPLASDPERFAVAGVLFCIAPLVELNGEAAVTIADLSFRSIVEWSSGAPSPPH